MAPSKDEVNPIKVVDDKKIVHNPSIGHVMTKRENKEYAIVFDKRIIVDNYCTKPYGF